jgi:enoyl-[acyl-carrier protein] reductase I
MAIQLLAGKRGVIFGALDDQSLAWKIADVCHQMGAKFTLTNAPVALRMGALQELAAGIGAEVIPADATSIEDLENLFTKSEEILGGKIDFVLHAIGMSINVRKKKPYTDLNHEWMKKTFDISAISFHKMCQVLYKGDHMAEWGSILGLTYIAAQRVFPDYGEMAESKALLESFARSFGYHFAEKNHVRVNTLSQSPTMTTAGKGIPGFTEFFGYGNDMSPLGNAPAEDCANFCATLFSDLSRYITMQNLYHDGGFSNMGMNPKLIK